MTSIENLLTTISEECAEIQQAVSKALRFGLGNHIPGKPRETNETDILVEYYQLQAVVEMLQRNGTLRTPEPAVIQRIKDEKRRKVQDYQALSKDLDLISDGPCSEKGGEEAAPAVQEEKVPVATGAIIRRLDDLGRVSLPKEFRSRLCLPTGSAVECSVSEEGISLKPYRAGTDIRGFLDNIDNLLVEYSQDFDPEVKTGIKEHLAACKTLLKGNQAAKI